MTGRLLGWPVLALAVALYLAAVVPSEPAAGQGSDDKAGTSSPVPAGVVSPGLRQYLPLLIDGKQAPAKDPDLITARDGGVIRAGHITLLIPPGALAQDAVIRIRQPAYSATLGEDGIEFVELTPAGLTFVAPVTLTIGYTESAVIDEDYLNVAGFRPATNSWALYPLAAQDKTHNRLSITLQQLSWQVAYADEPVYAVLEIPGKFLQSGDIIFALTPDCSRATGAWLMGHSSLYTGATLAGTSSTDLVESSLLADIHSTCPAPGGVQGGSLAEFTARSCSFYLGARRVAAAGPAQAAAARDFAMQQLGKGYRSVGQMLETGRTDECYSCSDLVEAAYAAAGSAILSARQQTPFVTPLLQYRQTVPVAAITAKVGDAIRIPVRGLVKVHRPPTPDLYQVGGMVQADGLPTGSLFFNNVFEWTPPPAAAGRVFTTTFRVTAAVGSRQHTRVQPLAIAVLAEDATATPAVTSTAQPTSTATPTRTPTTAPSTVSPSPTVRLATDTPVPPTQTPTTRTPAVTSPVTPPTLATATPTAPNTPTPVPTLPNRPPMPPAAPDPAHAALNQPVEVELRWTGGDPDGDALAYAVYLAAGDTLPAAPLATGLTTAVFHPPTLAYSTAYVWQVIATDARGLSRAGPVWRFTTQPPPNRPPFAPAAPAPSDGAAHQYPDVRLQWQGGDPDGDAVLYSVYLASGPGAALSLAAEGLATPSFSPGLLAYATLYAWQVVATDSRGLAAAGPVWRFTTMPEPPRDNVLPVWSPDGSRIAFVSYGGGGIYVMDLADRIPLALTDRLDDDAPAWSPDGSRIAFWSARDGDGEVYLANADGSGLANLTNNRAMDFFDGVSAWSPDGSRILFVSLRDGNGEVYVMHADGSNPVNLTRNPADDYAPVWSPDGSHILFVSWRDGSSAIYVMDADGSNPVNLSGSATVDSDPVWSPDGRQIALTSERNGRADIYVMDADGRHQTNLTRSAAADGNPAWSPDGSRIAFWTTRDGNGEIYLMNADGSNPVNVTNHPASDGHPVWSPDGSRIAFEHWQAGESSLYTVAPDGSNQAPLIYQPTTAAQ